MTLGLLRAELLRLFSDRKVAVVAVLVLGLGFWAGSSLIEMIKPYTALDWEEAQRQSNDAQINLDVICGSGTSGVDCSSLPSGVAVEGFLRPQLNFEQFAITTLESTTPSGLFAVVVLITVMIGSEFNTGSIGTQLTFTPRRLPLLWAKVAASVIWGVCLMAFWSVSMVGLDVFLYLNLRGTEGLVAGGTLAAQIGRALLVGAVTAAMAAMVTMALASTVKTWVLISAGLVLSQLLEASKNLAQIAGLLPTTNMPSLINGEWTGTIYNGEGIRQEPTPHLDYGYSLGYAAFWVVVFGIWASTSFSRRNILK